MVQECVATRRWGAPPRSAGVAVLDRAREGNRLLTVGEQAKAVGKKVGLVTSVPFNHATPAGFIAHNTNRNDYRGLATEMIDSGIDVIMGGGHPNFTDAHTSRASNWTWISSWVVATSWTGVTVATLLAVFVWDRRRRARAEAPAVARERTPVAA